MCTPTSFSTWMRNNLKNSYNGLITQDFDFVLEDNGFYTFIEEKYYSYAKTGPAQAIIYKMVDEILSQTLTNFAGCHKITVKVKNEDDLTINNIYDDTITNFLNDPSSYKDDGWYEDIIRKALIYLWNCMGNAPLKPTRPESTFSRPSKFKQLLNNENVSYESIDWVFVNYCSGYFIILSEKDTINEIEMIVDGSFARYTEDLSNGMVNAVKNPKSNVTYKYLGRYTISYDDLMENFILNDTKLNVNDIIRVLNLDTNEILEYIE